MLIFDLLILSGPDCHGADFLRAFFNEAALSAQDLAGTVALAPQKDGLPGPIDFWLFAQCTRGCPASEHP